jgi:hypothetical protein
VKNVEAKVDIAAPPERLWSVVSDLDSFSAWNPFMTKASGQLREGSRLEITIEPPGGKPMNFRPKVLRVQPQEEIRWLGGFLVPGLFDGEHSLAIVPNAAGGSTFTQRERFSGIVTWFSGKLFERTHSGFEAMNLALKQRCEAA